MEKELYLSKRNERILSLDIIRGFALFGILIVNMMAYHSPILYINPLTWWTAPTDHFAYILIDLFFRASFYPLFSMLFGYSFNILRERILEKHLPFNRMAMRRFCFLFFAGCLHAFFIWHGDILIVYALLGVLLLWILQMKMAPKILLLFGVFLYSISNAFYTLYLACLDFFLPSASVESFHSDQLTKSVIHIYQKGSFGKITLQRIHDWGMEYNPEAVIILFFTILPLFLIGSGLSKLKILENAAKQEDRWKKVLAGSFFLGLFIKVLPYLIGQGTAVSYFQEVFGGPLQSVSYACMIVLLYRRKNASRFLLPLSFVGKTSLTNYLFQSFLSTLIFYGYGMQLFGKISLFNGCLLAVSIFILQVILSYLWMNSFHYGPIEWLWRAFTYLKFPKWKKFTGS